MPSSLSHFSEFSGLGIELGSWSQSQRGQLHCTRSSRHLTHDHSNYPRLSRSSAAMASPAILGSRALRASRQPIQAVTLRRGYATAGSGSFQYETGEHTGVKYASRDLPGATTTLSVVAKAGTRYQPYPGFADALEKFAFKVHSPSGPMACTDHSTSPPESDQPYG